MASGRHVRPPGGETSHNLFSWSDGHDADGGGQTRNQGRSSVRHVGNAIGSQIFFGEDIEEGPRRMKTGSLAKQKEMSGSGIFTPGPVPQSSNLYANNQDQNTGNVITDRPTVRLHHPAGGVSSISLGEESPIVTKSLSPLKQMELSGTTEISDDILSRKAKSAAKLKEMNGTLSIFSPPGDQPSPPHGKMRIAQPEEAPERERRSVPVSNQPVGGTSSIFMVEDPTEPIARRASSAKVNALLGTGEYREEPPALHASQTKMKEMQGCNIFADGKPQIRDSLGGVREPPGGKSSVALI